MVDFVLGRIRFKFKGEWSISTAYIRDDVLTYGGRSYVCMTNHTSAATVGGFYTDLSANKWELMGDGFAFKGSWTATTYYKINDIVKWGSSLYVCNTGHTSGANWMATEANFTLFVGGLEFEDTFDANTLYNTSDVVRYGGYNFVSLNESQGILPTNTMYWSVLSTGFNHEGDFNVLSSYQPGDVVRYGAYTYVAKMDTTGNLPTNTTYWNLLNQGSRWLGDYTANTTYVPGDMVKYGGYLYIADRDTSGVAPTANTTRWIRQATGFSWKNGYDANTTYQLGDVVIWNGSSWICTSNSVTAVTPTTSASTQWNVLVQGDPSGILSTAGDILYRSSTGLERLGAGSSGQILTVDGSGFPHWEDSQYSANVYYVSPQGVDSAGYGSTLQRPFRTIKYATEHVTGPATIFVKSGTYSEQLPIVVPANTAIIGDAQREVIVTPASGFETSTMWRVSDGTMLKQMTFTGMTGFVPGSPDDDITAASVGGVFIRFNASSPIATKSPYILECSAISNGGIGVIVDGSVHASGYKSMVFHAYTNLNNDGVGYWIKDNGRAEIVSCFTYYCWFGIATSGGGFVRGLNNNNSYGRYGAVSRGFDTTESVLTGKVYGNQLTFSPGTTMAFNVGEFITGGTSGANGQITNVQAAVNKLYYWPVSGTFQNSEVVTGVTSTTTATTTSSGVTGQKGYVIVANKFTSEPTAGRSIQFDDDANNAYVIQSVSGTYSNVNSPLILVLAQEKVTASANAANVTIRQNFSQIRLTGHDFLDIGTGNTATANVPGVPSLPVSQGNEVVEYKPGRVYYVSTDQSGNFRVGDYFKVEQSTGRATLDASAFNLSGLSELRLGSIGAQLGETINEFSSDTTMGGDSNLAVPTEHAVKSYVESQIATSVNAANVIYTNTTSGLAAANVQKAIDSVNAKTNTMIQILSRDSVLFLAGTTQTQNVYFRTLLIDPASNGTIQFGVSGLPANVTAQNTSLGYLTVTSNGNLLNVGNSNVVVTAVSGNTTTSKTIPFFITNTYPVFANTEPTGNNYLGESMSMSYYFAAASVTNGDSPTHTLVSGSLPSWATLQANGAITGTTLSQNTSFTTYNFTVRANNAGWSVTKDFTWKIAYYNIQGQALYGTNVGTGTFSWTCPAGVTSVSVVAIGGGGAGWDQWAQPCGSGGGLGWKNNIPVTPGQTYTVVVGAGGLSYPSTTGSASGMVGGTSYFNSTSTVAGYGGGNAGGYSSGGPNSNSTYGGGWYGDGGGAGGYAPNYQGGGGAGGYAGNGGNSYGAAGAPGSGAAAAGGYYSSTYGTGAGGGVGLDGIGSTGYRTYTPWSGYGTSPGYGGGGEGGSGGTTGYYGENPFGSYGQSSSNIQGGTYGGGGGGSGTSYTSAAGNGGPGGVRIIWGPNRAFPGTNTADVPTQNAP